MASPESILRSQVATIVQDTTGVTTLNYKPEVSLPADFATIGVDPSVGYAYVHIPAVTRKSYDSRLTVEIHLLKQGVLNGTGYEDTSEWAGQLGQYITENQSSLIGFSDPAEFSSTRSMIEVAGFQLIEIITKFVVVSSAGP